MNMKFSFKKLFKFLLVILFIWAIYVLFFRKIVEGAGKTPPPPPPPKPVIILAKPLGSGGKYTKAQCSALSVDSAKPECQESNKKGYGCYASPSEGKCYGGV
jgi:hypothetical protein